MKLELKFKAEVYGFNSLIDTLTALVVVSAKRGQPLDCGEIRQQIESRLQYMNEEGYEKPDSTLELKSSRITARISIDDPCDDFYFIELWG